MDSAEACILGWGCCCPSSGLASCLGQGEKDIWKPAQSLYWSCDLILTTELFSGTQYRVPGLTYGSHREAGDELRRVNRIPSQGEGWLR